MHCKLGESWLCFLPQSLGRCFPSPSCSFLHSFHLPVSSLKQLCRIPWSRAGIHTKSRPVWVKREQQCSPRAEGKGGFTWAQNRAECSEWSPGRGGNECHISVLLAGRGGLALGILLQEFTSCVSIVELFLVFFCCCGFFVCFVFELH